MSLHPFLRAGALSVALCLAASAQGQSNCAACDPDDSPSLSTEDFLALNGLHGFDPEPLMTWYETARDGSGQVVYGFRLMLLDPSERVDLYANSDGELLSEEDVRGLGIAKKQWRSQGAKTNTEVPAVFSTRAVVVNPEPVGSKAGTTPDRMMLPAIDLERARAEDAQPSENSEKGHIRTGVFQVFDTPIEVASDEATQGTWIDVPGQGRLWSLAIESPGAIGQRLHIAEATLPEGVQLLVYGADAPEDARAPVASGTTISDVWAASVPGEVMIVECLVPPEVDAASLRLVFERSIHMYLDPVKLLAQKGAGSCNLDVTCFPEWAMTASSVGGMGNVGSTGSLFCTATLITDSDDMTSVPYLLAANHCIGDQDAASSIEMYWFYETDGCNGAVPSLFDIPRTTGGADFLAGSVERTGGNDFTLMRLRSDPPAGVAFAGWSSEAQPVDTATICIHHPQGDFKRITFGDIRLGPGPCNATQPEDLFYQSLWNDGTTEPGSSGSPLFNDQQQIIGQLYGGIASCSRPECPDYYGRFDVTFPMVQAFLGSENGEGTGEGLSEGEGEGSDSEPPMQCSSRGLPTDTRSPWTADFALLVAVSLLLAFPRRTRAAGFQAD